MHLLSPFSLNLPLYEHKKRPSYTARKETCINEGECPHVDSFPKEYLRGTGVFGIHIAMATGNEEALTTPCVKDGEMFGLDPFSMAILKTQAKCSFNTLYIIQVK